MSSTHGFTPRQVGYWMHGSQYPPVLWTGGPHGGRWHVPPTHTSPLRHRWPHRPQFSKLLSVDPQEPITRTTPTSGIGLFLIGVRNELYSAFAMSAARTCAGVAPGSAWRYSAAAPLTAAAAALVP